MSDKWLGFRAIKDLRIYPKRLFQERLRRLGIENERFSYALMPAKDDERVKEIGRLLESKTEFLSQTGERLYKGKIDGASVLVLNSGLGAPATALTFETLLHAGVHSFLRVGSAGALQPNVKTGDVVIPTGAVRGEGTSAEYVDVGYPSFPDPALLTSLVKACQGLERRLGLRWYTGVVWTHDAFFAENDGNLKEMSNSNVLAVEMEVATLFTLASLRRVRAAAVLAVTDNMLEGRGRGSVYTDPTKSKQYQVGSKALAPIAVEAVKLDLHNYRLLE